MLQQRRKDNGLTSLEAWAWRTKARVVFRLAGRLGTAGRAAPDSSSVLVVHDTRPLLNVDWDVVSVSHCGMVQSGPTHYQMPMADREMNLRNLITGNVASEDWIDNGGSAASVDILNQRMLVVAPVGHHLRISELLDLLKASDPGSSAISDELRASCAALARLDDAIIDFPERSPSNLEMLEAVGQQSGIEIKADWDALSGLRVRPEHLSRPGGQRRIALTALDDALAPPGRPRQFGFAPLAGTGLLATARPSLGSLPLAAYDARDFRLNENPDKPDADIYKEVQDIVTGIVATEDWVDNGGDQASLYWWRSKMVVRADARTHFEIQNLLAKMRAGGARPHLLDGPLH